MLVTKFVGVQDATDGEIWCVMPSSVDFGVRVVAAELVGDQAVEEERLWCTWYGRLDFNNPQEICLL
jgi:hypothetical protein